MERHISQMALIFDLDGTLFETESILAEAFVGTARRVREEGLYDGPSPSEEQVKQQLGKTTEELWKGLTNGKLVGSKAERATEILSEEEQKALQSGQGRLFPGVKETLAKLQREGFALYIASNGQEDYVRAVLDACQLTSLFKGIYTAGGRGTETKVDLVAILLEENQIDHAIMVGDRQSDIEAGIENNLPTIGCRFGFANRDELIEANRLIDRFDQLTGAVEDLLPKVTKVD